MVTIGKSEIFDFLYLQIFQILYFPSCSSYGGETTEYAARSGGDSYGRRSTRQAIAHDHHGGGGSEYDESKAVLAVFNLNLYTTDAELYDVFAKFGPLKKATIVIDAKVKFFWFEIIGIKNYQN